MVFDFTVGTLTADVGVGFAARVLALELNAGLKVLFKHKNELIKNYSEHYITNNKSDVHKVQIA